MRRALRLRNPGLLLLELMLSGCAPTCGGGSGCGSSVGCAPIDLGCRFTPYTLDATVHDAAYDVPRARPDVAPPDALPDYASRYASLAMDASCMPLPPWETLPSDDAGPRAPTPSAGADPSALWEQLVYASGSGLARLGFDRGPPETLTLRPPGAPSTLCDPLAAEALAQGFASNELGAVLGCLGGPGSEFAVWRLSRVDWDSGTVCPVLERRWNATGGGAAPEQLVQLDGALAWLQSDAAGEAQLQLLAEGAPAPRRVGPVESRGLAGGGAHLAWTANGFLMRSEAPFDNMIAYWNSGGPIEGLRADPDEPSVLSFTHGGRGAVGCSARADVAVADVSLPLGNTPILLTSDSYTQAWPVVRGPWVAYTDFASDPLAPQGCVGAAHERAQLVLANWRTLEVVVLLEGDPTVRALALGRGRVWFVASGALRSLPLPALDDAGFVTD